MLETGEVCKFFLRHGRQLDKAATASEAQPPQLLLLPDCVDQGCGLTCDLEQKHCQPEEDEEEEGICRAVEPICPAEPSDNVCAFRGAEVFCSQCGPVANLDHKHAQIHKHESEFCERHQRTIFDPAGKVAAGINASHTAG